MDHNLFWNTVDENQNENYIENSTIPENIEGEMNSSPQEQVLSEEIPKQRHFNDKSHLIWEQERLLRKREEYYRRHNPMTLHEYFKDPVPDFSISTTRGKMMPFDSTMKPKRSKKMISDLKSTIPILSDHYKGSKTHSAAASENLTPVEKIYYSSLGRNGNFLSNVFNQSEFQQRLQKNKNVNVDKPPASHSSFNKTMTDFNTARYKAFQAVSEGRQRMFHQSQVF